MGVFYPFQKRFPRNQKGKLLKILSNLDFPNNLTNSHFRLSYGYLRWPNNKILHFEKSSLKNCREHLYNLNFTTTNNKSFNSVLRTDPKSIDFVYSSFNSESMNEISYFTTGEFDIFFLAFSNK